ncbi:MAG: InlB B-repeat-containing protein [Kiritimatiellae bacterium]|nr:InlB B-repeat-containing protein [Kiritimatiellia bacterium]
MKKLIKSVVASIAVAFGVQSAMADEVAPINFLDFDNYLSYEKLELDYDAKLPDTQDTNDGVNRPYWVDGEGNNFAATTVIGTVRPYAAIPENAAQGEVEAYLELDTDAPVYRRIGVGENNATVAYDMGSVYIDTRVQFTAADESTESAISSSQDKIVVWMREKNMETEDPSTNLLITCGSDAGPRTYEVNEINGKPWEADKWYRLVIKSGKTLTASGNPGFLVYISDSEDLNDVTKLTKVSATYTALVQEPEAQEEGDETPEQEETPQPETETIDVFPSLITTGSAEETLSCVGYSGMGKIDEVTVTTVDPCPDVKYFNLTWDANIASLSYTVGDGEEVELDTDALALKAKTIELPPTGGTITITYTPIDGFTANVTHQNCNFAEGEGEGVVTVEEGNNNPSLAITTKANNFMVGGAYYETFAKALENLGEDKTIKLCQNVVLPAGGEDEAVKIDGQDVILDLAGKTIQATFDPAYGATYEATIIVYAGKLKIINSTPEIGHVLPAIRLNEDGTVKVTPGDAIYITQDVMYSQDSLVEITAGYFDGIVTNDGGSDYLQISGGSFKGDAGQFEHVGSVLTGCVANYDESTEYWTVALGGGEEPDPEPETVTYTITYSSTTGVVPEAKTVTVQAGTPYALTEEDLAPLADANGYRFSKWWMPGGENNVIAKVGDQITADVTLTASWVIREYTISYATEIGDVPTATTLMPYDANGATAIPANRLPELSAKGYVFGGWKLGDALVEADVTTITGDVTLTAVWSIKPYTISYINRPGATNPASKTVMPAVANGEFALTEAQLETFTMDGYNFFGYKYSDGTMVKVGDVITGDVTLTLAWNIKITYQTAYSVAPEDIVVDVSENAGYEIKAEDLVTLANVEGFEFSHWEYTNGTIVSSGNTVYRNTTLVAVWNAVTPVDPWAGATDDATAADKVEEIFSEEVAAEIDTKAEYDALVSYIKDVKGADIVPTGLTSEEKTYIVESLTLGAEVLFTEEPKVELAEVAADTSVGAEAGDWTFKVKVTQGESVELVKVAKDKVKELVKIRTDLTTGDWATPESDNIEVTQGDTQKDVSVKIKFGSGATRGFIRIKK